MAKIMEFKNRIGSLPNNIVATSPGYILEIDFDTNVFRCLGVDDNGEFVAYQKSGDLDEIRSYMAMRRLMRGDSIAGHFNIEKLVMEKANLEEWFEDIGAMVQTNVRSPFIMEI